jgi:ribosomal-protein-alanine N-acetyltransferase
MEKNSRIIGYAIVLIEPYFTGSLPNKRAHLINLAVHPDFRKKGLGTDLVEKIIKDMKSAKAHSIYLEVRKSNEAALEFYSKLLFQRIGLIKGFYLNEDAVVMSKKISN